MSAILKKLIWKEYQELKWGTAGAAAVALAMPLVYVFRDLNLALTGAATSLIIYPILAGVFFGMRAAAGERTNRSAGFVAALPVLHRFLGSVRIVSSLVASLIPLLLLIATLFLLNPWADESARTASRQLMAMCGIAVLGTMLSVTVSAAAALGQPTEIRAGVVGFGGLLITFILGYLPLLVIAQILRERNEPNEVIAYWIVGCEVAAAIAVCIFAAVSFSLRYSAALGPYVDPSFKLRRSLGWRVTLVPDTIAALVGKAVREMGLLGIEVLGVCVLMSVLLWLLGITGDARSPDLMDSLLRALPFMLLVGGFVLPMLIGVGAVIGDLQPGVNTFWRSRPISPHAWYWTKYAVGLATMLFTIELLALLMAGKYDSSITESHGMAWWLLVWNCTFSFALTATCLVRQPGYAAILAIGGVSVLYAVIEALFGSFTPGQPGAPMAILAPAFIAAFIGSTLLGWRAAVRDVSVT